MPRLIRLSGRAAAWAEDEFVHVADEDALPVDGAVILSFTRFQLEGDALLSEGRAVGVRLEAGQAVEDLAYDLPRVAVVAVVEMVTVVDPEQA